MRMRNLVLGMLTAGLANAAAVPAFADLVDWADVRADDKAMATIEVHGPSEAAYRDVLTKTLDHVIWAKGSPTQPSADSTWTFRLWASPPPESPKSKTYYATLYEEWNQYKVSQKYYDTSLPQDDFLAPIRRCNDLLEQTSGAAREAFLFKGATFSIDHAYLINTMAIDESGPHIDPESLRVPVRIKCLPLSKSPLRATLRIEPAKVQKMGQYLCPTELKLHGYVESHPKFNGKSIFVGPRYLTAMTALKLPAEGGRTVTATYEMDWHKTGGLTAAPNAGPAKQTLTFRFNIADEANKLLRSAEKTVDVSCRKK